MKIYFEERGSCRGDSFRGSGSFDANEVLEALKIEDEEKQEEVLIELMGDDGHFLYINCTSYDEDNVEKFNKILKEGKGYMLAEESMAGFGTTKKDAKVQVVDAIDECETGW